MISGWYAEASLVYHNVRHLLIGLEKELSDQRARLPLRLGW